jgi:hypothetical protein
MVKAGTKWSASNGKVFHVISVIELEGNTWVHYILEDKKDPKEYSCYQESFLSRFNPLPE